MEKYKFIRYSNKIVILWKDDSRCKEYDVVDQTLVLISTVSTGLVYKFLYDMVSTVNLRYLAKTAQLLSDGLTIVINDLGILWKKIKELYDLLEFDDLTENEQINVITSLFRR